MRLISVTDALLRQRALRRWYPLPPGGAIAQGCAAHRDGTTHVLFQPLSLCQRLKRVIHGDHPPCKGSEAGDEARALRLRHSRDTVTRILMYV
jgi:hypothetical protein